MMRNQLVEMVNVNVNAIAGFNDVDNQQNDDDDPLVFGALPLPQHNDSLTLIFFRFSQNLSFTVREGYSECHPLVVGQNSQFQLVNSFGLLYGNDATNVFPHLLSAHCELHFNSPLTEHTCWPGGVVVFGFLDIADGSFTLVNYTHHRLYPDVAPFINCCLVLEFFDILPPPIGFSYVLPQPNIVRILYYNLVAAVGPSFDFVDFYDVPMAPYIYDTWLDFILRFLWERHLLFGTIVNENIPPQFRQDHYPQQLIFGSLQHTNDPLAPSFYPFLQSHHLFAQVRHRINAAVVLNFF